MDFYTIIIIIASVLLIISLAGIGLVITNASSKNAFPSYVNPCPDYWTYGIDGSCVASTENLGKQFSGYKFKPSGKVCVDNSWASSNNILWDGVTNNSGVSAC